MGFNPADFQKEKGHGEVTAGQVNLYLQKEEDLCLDSILHAFHISLEESADEKKDGKGKTIPSRFRDAMDRVVEQIDQFSTTKKGRLAREELDIIVAHVNAAFRHYHEILEGCASQLFSQLDQMRVDQVGDDTIRGVEIVKDKLIRQITDCMEQVRRLERRLSQYRRQVVTTRSTWEWIRSFFEPMIERAISRKLRRIRLRVNDSFQQLRLRYSEYQQLESWAKERKARLEKFRIFQTLPKDVQSDFAEIYRLLKMLKKSLKTSDLVMDELNRLLREAITVEEAIVIFHQYADALKQSFFEVRLQVPKRLKEAGNLKQIKQDLEKEVRLVQAEVRVIGSATFRYRDFVLNTHPDPYVRARLGFAESTVGPEPEVTKVLVRLGHQVESLDKRFRKLVTAIESYDTDNPDLLELGYFDQMIEDVDRIAAEAKRPSDAAEEHVSLIEDLVGVRELYHFDDYRVMGVEKVLRLVLRLDHFNLLVQNRRFVEFYETHLRLREPITNEWQRGVLDRLESLNRDLGSLRATDKWRDPSLRTVINDKMDDWVQNADKMLASLEEYLAAMKAQTPISFEQLVGESRQRRFEVMEFLWAYRLFLFRLKDLGENIPPRIARLMERVNSIETDFSMLVSHIGRSRGPMSLQELRSLENL